MALPSKGVSFHWGGPKVGITDHSQCAEKVRQWQRFHQDTRGWVDIAYSMIVCPHGDVYEGRGVRNRSAANGTNTGNAGWHAVCYLGGEGDEFTDAGKRGMLDARAWLMEGGAGSATNVHSDHKPTGCPGGVIKAWQRAGMPVGTTPPPAPKPEPTKPTPTPTKPDDKETPVPPTLKEGMSGDDVRRLQALMVAVRHDLRIDGGFGPNTKRNVIAFQRARGLAPDGIVGPNTWRRLILG